MRGTQSGCGEAPSGAVRLGPLRASLATGSSRTLTSWQGWSLPAGGQVTRAPGGVRIAYAFQDTGARLTFRPAEPTDGRLMPVVVSPEIARAAGGLGQETTLDLQDVRIDARIVGVAKRTARRPSFRTIPFTIAEVWSSKPLRFSSLA